MELGIYKYLLIALLLYIVHSKARAALTFFEERTDIRLIYVAAGIAALFFGIIFLIVLAKTLTE